MEHYDSPLRFIYDMDDEIERIRAASNRILSGSDVSVKKSMKDLHGSSPSSPSSFDESVSTVPSYEDWSSHHSFTERNDGDEVDEDYFGDGEKEDDHDQHLQSNRRHPRTPTNNKGFLCDEKYGPSITTSSSRSISSPCEKKSKSKKTRNGSTTTNSKPKLRLQLKAKLVSGLISPKKKRSIRNSKKNDGASEMTEWQKELGLPAGTTEEEAISVLLTRELSALEL